MIIANPIYDVVFKYLLQDIEIARELLETILDEQITHIELKPQETTTEANATAIQIIRFDFKATIKNKKGELKKVLIELQKVKQTLDVMRFRRYLAENYRQKDEFIDTDGTQLKIPIPIITIYFLGFQLDNITNPIIKINRDYIDVITQKKIPIKEQFIELLTHDSYIIQLKKLTQSNQTKLQRVLQVFNPQFETNDKHQLNFNADTSDKLTQKMIDRLTRAIASNELRNIMDIEDELEFAFERELKKQMIKNEQQLIKTTKELIKQRKKTEIEQQKAKQAQEIAEQQRKKTEIEQQKAKQAQEIAQQQRKKTEIEQQKAKQAQEIAEQATQEIETQRLKNEELLKQIEELKKQLNK